MIKNTASMLIIEVINKIENSKDQTSLQRAIDLNEFLHSGLKDSRIIELMNANLDLFRECRVTDEKWSLFSVASIQIDLMSKNMISKLKNNTQSKEDAIKVIDSRLKYLVRKNEMTEAVKLHTMESILKNVSIWENYKANKIGMCSDVFEVDNEEGVMRLDEMREIAKGINRELGIKLERAKETGVDVEAELKLNNCLKIEIINSLTKEGLVLVMNKKLELFKKWEVLSVSFNEENFQIIWEELAIKQLIIMIDNGKINIGQVDKFLGTIGDNNADGARLMTAVELKESIKRITNKVNEHFSD